MFILEVMISALALFLSVISAGLFLRIKAKGVFLASLAGVLLEIFACWMVPERILWIVELCICLPVCILCMIAASKLALFDSVLAYFISASYVGLWNAFRSGTGSASEADLLIYLYDAFFLLHFPAVLLTFPSFSLPAAGRERLLGAGTDGAGLRITHLLAVGGSLTVLINVVVPLLSVAENGAVWTKTVLVAAIFWAGVSIMVLLAAYDRKREQSTAEGEYREDMNTFMNLVRSQRHDYNLHVQTVAGLIAQQKWEECRSYVNALVQDTADMNAILPVKDPAIAALIGHFRVLAAQRGIAMLVDVQDDMTRISTSTYETNKIMGNLLQNALDELEQQYQEAKRMELRIFKRGESCLIRVSNRVSSREAFAGNKDTLFRQGYTTKHGHDGVGLSSIRTLARRYGGDVSVWLEGDIAHFVASIPMKNVADTQKTDS